MIERLKILQNERGRFANGSELSASLEKDIEFRKEVEALTWAFFDEKVHGCRNCYMDAYLRLIHLNIDKAMEKTECKFRLLAGALLQDVVNADVSKNMSNANITNEMSLYHLKTNPKCRSLFQELPEGVDDMIEAYEIDGKTVTEPKSVEPKPKK